jgi:sugar phosphate isomerase/epimerase
MNEPISKYVNVGMIHFMAYPETIKGEGPIEETVRKIALDDYFQVIELTWIKDPAVRKSVKKICDTAHITIAYGGQPRLLLQKLNINALDAGERKKAVDTCREGIDEAAELGSAGFAFLSGTFDTGNVEASMEALIESTGELCSYAKEKNITVIHEIFDHDIDKKSLVGPADRARAYAEAVCAKYDNFGLMADLSHLPLLRESPRESLEPIKEYLVHAHMGNCVVKSPDMPAYGDVHPRFGFPGSENDVEELVAYIRALFEVGYLGDSGPKTISFEVKPFGDEEPDLVIANAKRVLNAAWARV